MRSARLSPAERRLLKCVMQTNACLGTCATRGNVGGSQKTWDSVRRRGLVRGHISVNMTPKGLRALGEHALAAYLARSEERSA